MYEIPTYILNLHKVVCQLNLREVEGQKKRWPIILVSEIPLPGFLQEKLLDCRSVGLDLRVSIHGFKRKVSAVVWGKYNTVTSKNCTTEVMNSDACLKLHIPRDT